MAVVKVTDKETLDNLVAKITLRLGQKPTQQDVLDLCIKLGLEHFEELIEKLSPFPILDDEKINQIIEFRNKVAKFEWIDENETSYYINQDDKDIYSV